MNFSHVSANRFGSRAGGFPSGPNERTAEAPHLSQIQTHPGLPLQNRSPEKTRSCSQLASPARNSCQSNSAGASGCGEKRMAHRNTLAEARRT